MSGAIVMRIKGLEQKLEALAKELETLKAKVPVEAPKRRGRPPKVRDEDAGSGQTS